ncbi:MAG: bifunctional pyr operon transcriptional regulator/uracil phosphoribosyltransferase PyrR [Verrucomicrobiales bacterium]
MPNTLSPASPQVILDAEAIGRLVSQLAEGIAKKYSGGLVRFVGIEKRGVFLARRTAVLLEDRLGPLPCGRLDISLYRDDLEGLKKVPDLRGSEIPFDMDGASVVLFDDVLYTGRTIRAAIEELMDFGRPARVELAALLDRGHRELPIQPDYCGFRRETGPDEYIRVRLRELDGEDEVILGKKEAAS